MAKDMDYTQANAEQDEVALYLTVVELSKMRANMEQAAAVRGGHTLDTAIFELGAAMTCARNAARSLAQHFDLPE